MTMIEGKINGPWNTGHWPTFSLQSLSDIDLSFQVSKKSSRHEAKLLDHKI